MFPGKPAGARSPNDRKSHAQQSEGDRDHLIDLSLKLDLYEIIQKRLAQI